MSNDFHFDTNNKDWLEKRKCKEFNFNQEEYLRQNLEKNEITDKESAILFSGEIISNSIKDLKPITKKIARKDIAFVKRLREDAYSFLFIGDRLDDFLAFWGYEITADVLRSKIKRKYPWLNMPHMRVIQVNADFSIMPLENIGIK